MQVSEMVIGERYNFQNQPERLIYLGKNFSGNGYWHQFEKVNEPNIVWSEMQDSDLDMMEVTVDSDMSWLMRNRNPFKSIRPSGMTKNQRKRNNKKLTQR